MNKKMETTMTMSRGGRAWGFLQSGFWLALGAWRSFWFRVASRVSSMLSGFCGWACLGSKAWGLFSM